jgi:hypothetical protein
MYILQYLDNLWNFSWSKRTYPVTYELRKILYDIFIFVNHYSVFSPQGSPQVHVKEVNQKKYFLNYFPVPKYSWESSLSGVFSLRKTRLTGVSITWEVESSCCNYQNGILLMFKSNFTTLPGIAVQKLNCGYFNNLLTCDSCLKKAKQKFYATTVGSFI